MKIALVHDFLTQLGGAERVLEEFHQIFPNAPVYTLVYDSKKLKGKYDSWDVRTSFIDRLPGGKKRYKWYLPLMPKAIESFDLRGFDLILSDASAYAKGIIAPKGVKHLCYCHTPTRYLWQMQEAYLASQPYPWVVKQMARPVLRYLKSWDKRAAQRVDYFLANSIEVKNRIENYHNRSAEVVYPPVKTDFFTPSDQPKGDYFFAASRLEPYKRLDLVVDAFNDLGLPLVIAGSGTAADSLRLRAAANIKFAGRVSDEEMRELYRKAKAFIFAAHEDAGIMILESMACGTPVIAYRAGGAIEFIKEGVHGAFFDRQDARALSEVVKAFDEKKFTAQKLRLQAEKFSVSVFREKIIQKVRAIYADSN